MVLVGSTGRVSALIHTAIFNFDLKNRILCQFISREIRSLARFRASALPTTIQTGKLLGQYFLGSKAQGQTKLNRTEMTFPFTTFNWVGLSKRGSPGSSRCRRFWSLQCRWFFLGPCQTQLHTEVHPSASPGVWLLVITHCWPSDRVSDMYLWSTNHVPGSPPGWRFPRKEKPLPLRPLQTSGTHRGHGGEHAGQQGSEEHTRGGGTISLSKGDGRRA